MEENEFLDLGFMSDDDFLKLTDSDNESDNKTTKEEKTTEDDNPESVGSYKQYNLNRTDNDDDDVVDDDDDDDDDLDLDLDSDEQGDSSNNFSSIAKALRDIEVLHLNDDDLDDIDSPEAFSEAIEKEIYLRRNVLDQRIIQAISAGVNPKTIDLIERNLNQLRGMNDVILEDENNSELRRSLIFNSYLALGFSEDKAKKYTEKSFLNGDDIDDAKEARDNLAGYYNESYNAEILRSQNEQFLRLKQIETFQQDLKESIFDDLKIYKDLSITNTIRSRIYENAMINTEPYHNTRISKLRKYAIENPIEYNKWVATFFTLTDGFTNIKNILNGAVNTETKKRMNNLEKALKTTNISRGGNMKLTSGVDDGSSLLDFSGNGGWEIADD